MVEGNKEHIRNSPADKIEKSNNEDGKRVGYLLSLDTLYIERYLGRAIVIPHANMATSTVLLFLAMLYRANPSTPKWELTSLLTNSTISIIRI
jgi:hypothetical protein